MDSLVMDWNLPVLRTVNSILGTKNSSALRLLPAEEVLYHQVSGSRRINRGKQRLEDVGNRKKTL